MTPRRRTSDVLNTLNQLVDHHVQGADAEPLVNLAVVTAAEYTGARRAILLREREHAFVPGFGVGPDLRGVDVEEEALDLEMVAEAARERSIRASAARMAAPVLVGGKPVAVLYVEAGAEGFPADAETLTRGAASAIGKLLHSARLLGDAVRRTRNVETLESIGEVLAAGGLTDQHLAHALGAALSATSSQDAVLALLAPDGKLLDVHSRGAAPDLRALAVQAAELIVARRPEEALELFSRPALLEPLRGEVLAEQGPGHPPLGFLLVRRPGGAPYHEEERTVLRALAHLLAGAIARLEYYRKASEDTLTGTGSRLALELAIVEKVERARRTGTPLSVLLIDIDRFKSVNDTHGHLQGDAVLKGVAETLQARLRTDDFVARFGGDEFLVLLPDTAPAEALGLAEELRGRVAAGSFGHPPLRVTLSIGIAAFPAHAGRPRDLVRRADEALYLAKAAGRNAVAVAPEKG